MGQNTSREETKLSLPELREVKEELKAKANPKLKARRPKPQPEPMPSLPSLSPHPSSSTIPYDQELQRPASIHLPTFSSNTNGEDINMAEEAKKETLQKSLLEEDEINEEHIQKVIPFSYTIEELKRGIYINNHTMQYWVEKGNNCFMVLARGLEITWIRDEQFWSWTTITENDTQFEVAKLLDVCWLEIHGNLNVTYLNPGVRYKVVFVVKMEERGYGWDNPVNLRLKLPEKSSQIRAQSLKDLSKKEWTELEAGIIAADTERRGEMQFSLYDYTGGLWKRGLLVKGVTIKPEDCISSRDIAANGSMTAQNDQRTAQSETKEQSGVAVKRAPGEKKNRRTS
ncbi:Protein PHLOEM PROTEIN 2-LIKE A1 [Platanthera zijinensis]|uniref:Protein PHLOEM PROTEIN 2-LIKE A1 n=1 Tax=Platanthera zijinensis TaxID=2320716 RepID=A0AAP0G5P6_9ASPA